MKICVVGLGLIGGSICMALKRAGHIVDGFDCIKAPMEYALKCKAIDNEAKNFDIYDVVFVAVPPKATIEFITNTTFKNGAIVSDICGVKKCVEDEVLKCTRNFNYVGCHPMAGKEVSGIENACAELFDKANMVITKNTKTNSTALETIRTLVKEIGFKRIVECSAELHDRKIAYTSQLAHIVSNSYVRSEEINNCIGFTGGSFQDMTRIAGVDENMWASLYLSNSSNLSKQISTLINSLEEIKNAIDDGNSENLSRILAKGRKIFAESKELKQSKDITIEIVKEDAVK